MGLRDRLLGRKSPEDAFTEEIARRVPEVLPGTTARRVEPLTLDITHPDGSTMRMFLHNMMAETDAAPADERGERLRNAVLAMTPTERPETWPAAAPRLMPAIRAIGWAAAHSAGGRRPVMWPFAPFLIAVAAVDSDYAMSYVTAEDLETWGVDAAAVEDAAQQNFAGHGAPLDWAEGEAWVDFVGPTGYVSSWLTRPDALAEAAARVGGDFVALAPDRDTLRLTAIADRTRLARELEATRTAYDQAPRQLSPVPYRVDDGRVVEWEPAPDDPCRDAVHAAKLLLAATEYGIQQPALQEQMGDDVFVASYGAGARDGGRAFSWSTWGKDVPTLAPETEFLALAETDEESRMLFVRFTDARRLLPDLVRPAPDCDPPRWSLSGWPTEAQLTELRTLAVKPGDDPGP